MRSRIDPIRIEIPFGTDRYACLLDLRISKDDSQLFHVSPVCSAAGAPAPMLRR
jgi:hypothetical protein